MEVTLWLMSLSDMAVLVAHVINIIGLTIIAVGVFVALTQALIDGFYILIREKPIYSLMHVRRNLAIVLLLWLEFVVAADIIHTMIHFDLHNLSLLWLLVAIRIVIWYTLEKEIQNYEKAHPETIIDEWLMGKNKPVHKRTVVSKEK